MDRQQMPFLFRFLSDSELYAFNVAFSFAGKEMWRFHWKISIFR